MSDGTADGPDPRSRGRRVGALRLFVASLVVGIGLVALGSTPASAVGPATQIVLTASSGTLLLVGHPTTLTATIEDSGGQTVTALPDGSANVTFTQISGLGTVSGLGSSHAVAGVASVIITPTSVGDDMVNLQASATLMTAGLTLSNVLNENFDADHGISAAKSCASSTPIGQPLECQYRISNNLDTANDTLTISNLTDQVFAYDGTVTSPDLLSFLTLTFSGGATCNVGHSVCTLPAGSVIASHPFSFYTVVADDYKLSNHQLTDQVTVSWMDLCNGGSGNCSPSPQSAQGPSATTVTLNTPSVSTALTPPGPVPVGTLVTDHSTLTGAGPSAGGTVSYAVFSNDTCTTLVASLGTATVTAGAVGPSTPWTATVGSYWFQATYSGDLGDVGPVSSSCASEPLTVVNPGIGITKLPASQTVAPGGTATWTIVVTNTSATNPLTSVTVTDPAAPACARLFSGTLAPGASETGYSCSLADVTTSFTNIATATGTPPVLPVVTASAQANVVVAIPPVVELYVNPANEGGSDTNNNCLLPTKPCATIGYGLIEEATLAPDSVGSVINLSKGTFNSPECTSDSVPDVPPGCDSMFAALTPANSNVTITGTTPTGLGAVVVEPDTCSSLPVVVGGPNNGQQAIVTFNTGEDGITVENMDLNGATVAGGGCANYVACVIDTGGTTGDAVVGDSMQCGTTYGILTNGGADSTIISNSLTPVLCTTTVKGPNTGLNAGWTSPANLDIKALPACAKFKEAGHGSATGVFINGVAYCAIASATKKTLVITGTPTPGVGCIDGGTPINNSGGLEIAKGATVIFNTSVAPFTQWGIACNSPLQPENQSTDCAISDNTVAAGGTVYGDVGGCGGLPPVGIVATGGATANVDGNSVSDVADILANCPEVGETTNDGIGIGFLPDQADGCSAGPSVIGVNDANSPTTGTGNTLGSTSANDDGIVVSGNTGDGCSDVNPPYQVNGNSVTSANKAGIVLTNLGFGNGTLMSGEPMAGNAVSGVATGAGIVLQGVEAQTIGGILASEGNSSTGNGEGLLLEPCLPLGLHPFTPPGCATYAGPPVSGGPEATKGNVIQNNTMTGNVAFGVFDVGSFQPNELAAATPTTALESSGNTFNANSWGTATNGSNGTNPSEVNGAEVMDGTGWGGGCHSIPGDCPTTAGIGPLVFEGPNTTFSSSSPGTATFTLSLCNAGPVSEVLPTGTQITFNAAQPDDGGTFFVTKDAIITGNAGCTGTFYNLSLQAVAPAYVGTLLSPSGQPYTLAQGDIITVNANGSTIVPSANFYGQGTTSNSCTPAGVSQTAGSGPPPLSAPHPTASTPNVFGATDPPAFPFAYSTTLQASTGGVNATYSAC